MGQHGRAGQGRLGVLEGLDTFCRPVDRLLQSLALLSLVQRSQDVSYVVEEAIVEGHHPDEPLELADCAGAWEGCNSFHLRGEGGHTLRGDLVPEKVKGNSSELTLCRIDNQPMLAEPCEKGPEVGQVFLFHGARDEDVIEVDEEEGQVLEHECMRRWKVCAAFLRPKGIRINSKRPKGVTTAVLGMSTGCTGT